MLPLKGKSCSVARYWMPRKAAQTAASLFVSICVDSYDPETRASRVHPIFGGDSDDEDEPDSPVYTVPSSRAARFQRDGRDNFVRMNNATIPPRGNPDRFGGERFPRRLRRGFPLKDALRSETASQGLPVIHLLASPSAF